MSSASRSGQQRLKKRLESYAQLRKKDMRCSPSKYRLIVAPSPRAEKFTY